MTNEERAREINDVLLSIRMNVAGGYDEERNPVEILAAALDAAEARGIERAAEVATARAAEHERIRVEMNDRSVNRQIGRAHV